MRQIYLWVIAAFIVSMTCLSAGSTNRAFAAQEAEGMSIPEEIRRLYKEAPSIEAYQNVRGVVWQNSYRYDLTPDGSMRKTRVLLVMCGRYRPEDAIRHFVPVPRGEGVSFAVKDAGIYNPTTGAREGVLQVKPQGANGYDSVSVDFQRETEGRVAAIVTEEIRAGSEYFDDMLFLDDSYPIWEQKIEVNIPDGLDLYWKGDGIRDPSRRKAAGREIITWSLMNQPAWDGNGIVEARRPSLAFSLRKGIPFYLRAIQDEFIKPAKAPPMPSGLNVSDKTNLLKAGANIASYLSGKQLEPTGYTPQLMKARNPIPASEPWTRWEQTLIAGKWLESLGHIVEVFWSLAAPIPADGPAVRDSWAEPVLVVKAPSGKKEDIYYKAGQDVEFGIIPPSLCGESIYRMNGPNLERRNIPAGKASDHTLGQTWKLALDENGIATGTLEITASGAWVSTLGTGRLSETESPEERLMRSFILNAPGLALSSPTVKLFDAGYRIGFSVRAALGIVSGNEMLMRVPAVVPRKLEEISAAGEKYSFRFPFTLEHNLNISTPRGYKVIGSPPTEKQGDSKAMLDMSMIHWPKRGQLEASGKWILRAQDVDESLSKTVLSELNSFVRWSQTPLPLRKK